MLEGMPRHGRSMDPKASDRIRVEVQAIIDGEFGKNSSALARHWKLTPGGLHTFMSRKSGAGWAIIEALARHTKRTEAEVIAGTGPAESRTEPEPGMVSRVRSAIGNHVEWLPASEQAIKDKRFRFVPPEKLHAARDETRDLEFAQLPDHLDPSWVARLIQLMLDKDDMPEVTEDDPRLPPPVGDPTGMFTPARK